jgi:hypothetical protein
MFAKVENNQVIKVSSQLTDFIPFEHARVWDKAQREANGLYDVNYDTSNLKSEEFYINGAETIAFANGQVTATYGQATAKKLEDVNAVDQNGQPVLDQDGKQVIILGLKSNHVARIKSQAADALQSTDWYIIRNAESGASIPANVATYRAAVRSKSNDMEALINAVSTVEQLAALYTYDIDTKSRPLGDFPRL